MLSRFRSLLLVSIVLASVFGAQPAEAQLRRVLDLNRQAMDAYTNLELDTAMNLLQEALQTAQRGGVTGSPLARTYLNLGVVSIGGFGDNGQGLQYFTQALQADGNIQLDPLTSTPDIQSVFTLARNRAGTGGGGTPSGGGDTGGDVGGGGGDVTPVPSGPGNIPHRPISEQLTNTALPIFVEAPEDAPVGEIFVYYKAPGMRDFRRLQMRRMDGGFGLELSDLLFAVDSVSAIVAQVPNLFLAYTSAVFAMLGLRATFFIIDVLVKLFTLLKYGVGAVLVIEVDVIDPQPLQARLARTGKAGARCVLRICLADEEQLVANAAQRLGYQRFRHTIAVHFGRIDERHAQFDTGA